MNIKGVEVSDAQVDACINRMRAGSFRAKQIATVAIDVGVPMGPQGSVPDRLADRLIQREKKAGNIELRAGNLWLWKSKP